MMSGGKAEEKAEEPKVKEEPTTTTTTTTEASRLALRQVEYYFSDESFPFDDYIQSKVDEEGWVALEEIASFPKMKKITEDAEVIAAALRSSDSVEVSEDSKKLRRKFPTPDEDPDASKTAFVSGFGGKDLDAKETLEAAVREWTEKHGTVAKVRALRDLSRGEGRELDGSAFATFDTEAEAQKAASLNGAVVKGRKLTVYTMPDWFARLRKKRDAIKKKKTDSDAKKEERAKSVAAKIPPGSVLSFAGLGSSTTREHVRDAVKAKCPDLPVKWIDYEKGNAEAFLRFETPDVAKAVLTALGDTAELAISDTDVTSKVSLLGGDQHAAYVARATDAIAQSQQKRKHQGQGGNRNKNRRLS